MSDDEVRLLVFSKTGGFRHDSIPAALEAMETLADEHGWQMDATEDASWFELETLQSYRAVVFLMTSDDVLDRAQQTAFEGYIQGGGGFVGVHSASASEYDWPWYGELVGAWFSDHPVPQDATLHVVDHDHPATEGLPAEWMRFDEWYNFATNPSAQVDVLVRLDESTYEGGTMGRDHPIAWSHQFDGGRSFYTALGHTQHSYEEPLFLEHLAGGIIYAAGTMLEPEATDTGLVTDTHDPDIGSSNDSATSSEPEAPEPAGTTDAATTATNLDPDAALDEGSGCQCNADRGRDRAPMAVWLGCLLLGARRHERPPAVVGAGRTCG
jgi:type 1 glutamine amidotransferase